jgi:outer membrane biosynthesis protein TonB
MPELGQALFLKISKLQPILASKITIKLLEGHTNAGIARLYASKCHPCFLMANHCSQSDEPALHTEVARAASVLAEQLKTKNGPADKEKSVEAKTVTAASQEAVIRGSLAALQARIGEFVFDSSRKTWLTIVVTTTEGLKAATVDLAVAEEQVAQRTDTQGPFNTVTPDSQPARAKKPSKNKKKKQQQPDTTAKNPETAKSSKTGKAAETTETNVPIPNTASVDQIDSNDPFHEQLKGIEAIKRGFAGPANTQDTESQHHASIAKSVR